MVMNETVFLIQIFLELLCLGVAVRMGCYALVTFVSLSALLANLFVLKQIVLFGFHVTCSDALMIGGMLGLNLVRELYGREAARSTVYASLAILLFYVVLSQVHLWYGPSSADGTHDAYATILQTAPRIVIASLVTYAIGQWCDLWFFTELGKKMRSLRMRLLVSVSGSQLVDTVLFSFFGLYGIVESIGDIIAVSFVLKCVIIAASAPIAAWYKKWVWVEG